MDTRAIFTLVLFGVPVVTLLVLGVLSEVPIKYNVRNLLVRWRITMLTGCAFTLVVALLIYLLSFVNGLIALTKISAQEGNVIVLSGGATDEAFSNLSFSDVGNLERESAHTDPEDRELKRPIGVAQRTEGERTTFLCSRETYVVVSQPRPAKEGEPERRRFIQVRGIVEPEVSGEVHGLTLQAGAWFSEAGVREVTWEGKSLIAKEAVMGHAAAGLIAGDLGRSELTVQDVLVLGGDYWVVAGLLNPTGSSFDSEIWGKQQIVSDVFRKPIFSSVVLRTATNNVKDARILAHHLRNNYRPAVEAQAEVDYYAKLNETNNQFLFGIGFIALFMAVGGVFGVMNTMFAAVSQRSRDIGVLQLLGYSRSQILLSFLLESLFIALAGGVLGCLLGSLCHGWSATSIVSSGGPGKTVAFKMVVDLWVLAVGLAYSTVMGFGGGLLPAFTATRLRPLDALR